MIGLQPQKGDKWTTHCMIQRLRLVESVFRSGPIVFCSDCRARRAGHVNTESDIR